MNDPNRFNLKEHKTESHQFDKMIREKIKDNKNIRKHLKEMRTLTNCIADGLIVLDRYNRFYILNQAGKDFFYDPDSIKYAGDGLKTSKYYNLSGRQLKLSELAGTRAIQGEIIKNEVIKVVRPDKTAYYSMNVNPILDKDNRILFAIFCVRDISEDICNCEKIAVQQENLLRTETEKTKVLESSIKLKDDFLYLITHEFRTPISVIDSALQAIEIICKDELTDRISKYLRTIRQNTFRQLRLVNNLLDNIRIGTGNSKFFFTEFDIECVTQEIVHSVEIYSHEKGTILELDSRLINKLVILDEEKYERILLNLLSNAIKFTPKGKRITVCLEEKKDQCERTVCISVKDEGIGIPKDKQWLIFERFGQVDGILSRKNEGTGLGLHLVKLIVNSLNGELALDSEEGKGSTFSVSLPVDRDAEKIRKVSDFPEQYDNNRIEQSVSIEFSEIYYD